MAVTVENGRAYVAAFSYRFSGAQSGFSAFCAVSSWSAKRFSAFCAIPAIEFRGRRLASFRKIACCRWERKAFFSVLRDPAKERADL